MLERTASLARAADSASSGTRQIDDFDSPTGSGSRVSNATAVAAFGAFSAMLVAIGPRDYPTLHTILDTATCLLSGVLALQLWDKGVRTGGSFPRFVAIAFAATSALEFIHLVVVLAWSGPLAPTAAQRIFLRPATWPSSAYLLPIAIAIAMRLRHGGVSTAAYAVPVLAAAAALLAVFAWLPAITPGFLGISRPALILAPPLWAALGWASWQLRDKDRLMRILAQMAAFLFIANAVMLYSAGPDDVLSMIAHLGRVCGYLAMLLCLMRLASIDSLERMRAEAKLARSNEELERRVLERTAQFETSNRSLEAEVSVRRQAEQRAEAQLERLNLLNQITQAIGERQDLDGIFQVVVRSLEDQLPVDFTCLCLYDATDRALTVACVGAKSGTRRISGLTYMPHDGSFVVVGSNGGGSRNPGWVHNLRAFPDTEVLVGPEKIKVRAREPGDGERQRLWAQAARYHPAWGRFQQLTPRALPIVILDARET